MSEIEDKAPLQNPLNRRKPENRWTRILRDADWEQNETVRRWMKFAKKVFDKEDRPEDAEEISHSDAA